MILVTGANGLVGSCAVERLAGAGKTVLAVGRGPKRIAAAVEYVEQDFADPEALRALIVRRKPASVLHCAAMTDVDACEKDPRGAWLLNVRAVEAAALGSSEVSARLVALSTDYVFDGERGPYSEDDAPNPHGAYARTKRAGEEAALLLAGDRAVCRVAVVYSGRKGAKRTFATGVVENLLARKPVKAFHDQIISPTLADNAAEMCLAVLASGEQGIFHCAGASQVSRVEFCVTLARKLGADEKLIEPVSLREARLLAPRPLHSALRVEKVRRLATPLPLDAALDRFLAERRA